MLKPKNNVRVGWIWVTACLMIIMLGSNHLYGYSFIDSFLDGIGIGSWTKEGKLGLHISSVIALPLLLFCFIQSVRYMKIRYPNIAITLVIGTIALNGIYSKLTEHVVRFSEFLIR